MPNTLSSRKWKSGDAFALIVIIKVNIICNAVHVHKAGCFIMRLRLLLRRLVINLTPDKIDEVGFEVFVFFAYSD